jgi:LysM repeat protein
MGFKKIFLSIIVLQFIALHSFSIGIKKASTNVETENSGSFAVVSSIDISYNDEVQNFSESYQANDNKKVKLVLDKGQNYFQMIENIFAEEGIPTELKYLAYVESNYNTKALSRAGARGMWQFMRGTAITYGLKVNRQVDERLNPEKSTRAAAIYFKKLYSQYNNWHMAIAAYNCGEGLIDFAVNKANGSNDFWEITKFLPRETRNYVPHFLGLMDAMNSYSAQQELNTYLNNNGVQTSNAASVAENNTTAFITSSSSINNSETNSTQKTELKSSNTNTESYPIVEAETRSKEYFVYIVKKGDTIELIAKNYPKNPVSLIKDNNNLASNADLNMGGTLLLEK